MSWAERLYGALVVVLLLGGGVAAAVVPGSATRVSTVAQGRSTSRTIAATAPAAVSIDGAGSGLAPMVVDTTVAPVTTLSTTTTTVVVKPVVAPRTVRAAAPAPVAAPAPPPVEPSPADDVTERCESARSWVAARGLALPAGWDYRCPDRALDPQGNPHWGIACVSCPTGSFVGINMDLIGSSQAILRYVVAHEICHAIEYATLGLSTEITADLCAALHGAPRP